MVLNFLEVNGVEEYEITRFAFLRHGCMFHQLGGKCWGKENMEITRTNVLVLEMG